LINNINLIIICNPTPFLTQLPTLQPNTLQTSVTQLQISSSIINTKGPLIVFPTNICSYPNVQILDLSSNNISGLLNTSQLACLGSNLLQIDLSSNSINDIDKNLFQSNGNLQTIDLSSNNLTSMPSIDGSYFVTFPSSISSMNFSFNQITNVDLWPLFVRTGK
jgi:Leucine-rich repeat (LRR) protein